MNQMVWGSKRLLRKQQKALPCLLVVVLVTFVAHILNRGHIIASVGELLLSVLMRLISGVGGN